MYNEDGTLMHAQRCADFREAVRQSSVDVDIIISGHMHVGHLSTLDDFETPVLVTGAAGPINSGGDGTDASTWLVCVTDDGIDTPTRHPL